ncbi:MAG: hypothetical protein RLZZ337_749 [Bacteroidota bacterium]|jgi:thioredoxin-related protein
MRITFKKIMKKLVSIILLISAVSFAFMFSIKSKTEDSIQFSSKSFDKVLDQASSSNKLVFIDVSTSWCGYCQKMNADTYTDAEVIRLVNTKFISKSIDAEKGEGISIASKYKVRGYPTVLILDSKGKLLKKQVGYLKPNQLKQFIGK